MTGKHRQFLLMLFSLFACSCFQADAQMSYGRIVSYRNVRQVAEKIRVQDIDCIEFSGESAVVRSLEPTVIKDRTIIRQFLQALQQAENNLDPLLYQADQLIIHFKRHGDHQAEPIILPSKAWSSGNGYGYKFDRLLWSLPVYIAEQVHKVLRDHASHVKAIVIDGDRNITNSGEVKRILDILKEIDRRQASIHGDSLWLGVQLLLEDGKHIDLDFVVGRSKSAMTSNDLRLLNVDSMPSTYQVDVPSPLYEYAVEHIKKHGGRIYSGM